MPPEKNNFEFKIELQNNIGKVHTINIYFALGFDILEVNKN